jgi:hypothetical protein
MSRYGRDVQGLGLDAAPRTESYLTLKALPLLGPFISYQHHWTRSVRWAATFGFVQLQHTAFQPGNTYHKSIYSVRSFFMASWSKKDGAKANAPQHSIFGKLFVREAAYGRLERMNYFEQGVSGASPTLLKVAFNTFPRRSDTDSLAPCTPSLFV